MVTTTSEYVIKRFTVIWRRTYGKKDHSDSLRKPATAKWASAFRLAARAFSSKGFYMHRPTRDNTYTSFVALVVVHWLQRDQSKIGQPSSRVNRFHKADKNGK